MIYYILLILLINLCVLNLLILDFIEVLNRLEIKINSLNKNSNKLINLDNHYFSNHNNCLLNCTLELDKITYYYDNLTPYKNIYKMMPVKNEKKNNNECIILYYNIPIPNNKYNKTNMSKDKRIFTFKSYNIEQDQLNNINCNWYITSMSNSIWGKKIK